MTSSRCVVVVVVVVVVALFVSLRVSLPTQGEKGRGKKFCCFCEVLCVKSVSRSEERRGTGQRSRLRRPFLWRSKNQKKKSIAGFVNLQNRYA